MILKIDIHRPDKCQGNTYDWVEVDITLRLREKILNFYGVLNRLDAAVALSDLGYCDHSAQVHFADPQIRVEAVDLKVSRYGHFWWEGRYTHRLLVWRTALVPLAVLDAPPESVLDLRQPRLEEEVSTPARQSRPASG